MKRPSDFIVHEISDDMELAGEPKKDIPPIPDYYEEMVSSPQQKKEPTPPSYCPYDEDMKSKICEFVHAAKSYGFSQQLDLDLPPNQKLSPDVLRDISVSYYFLALCSGTLLIYPSRVVQDPFPSVERNGLMSWSI